MTPLFFDVATARLDFPILTQKIWNKPLVYLDNAASTQKPKCVLEAMRDFYEQYYSNIHRGVHQLSERATSAYEQTRQKVQRFINAHKAEEIIFLKSTTEAINLVAQSYARPHLYPGDEILVSHMEHHSNLVPWLQVCQQTGAQLKVIPITESGELCLEEAERLLNSRTRLLSITHLSNVLGTLNPIKDLIKIAHKKEVPVLLDGAQAIAHFPVDVLDLDCDFYAFSGHKMYGPTGIGVLYGKFSYLEEMPPWQGGGGMITQVSLEKVEYHTPPYRFEAGTPPIAEVIGLGAAIDYLTHIDRQHLITHEAMLLQYATDCLQKFPNVRIIGTAPEKAAVISFVLEDIHAHDIATILDREVSVAVRAGHHCAMPLMERFQVPATVRASFGLYNTKAEVDALVLGLHKVQEILGKS